jgi:hypothetical protein
MPALYGALGAFVVVWVVATFGFRRSGKHRSGDPTSPEAALAEKCRAFGLDVKQFVAERRHGRPVFRAATEAENLRALSSLEATKAQLMATAAFPADPVGDRRRGEIEDYDRETLRLFHEQLGRTGAALFDRAVAAGVADPSDEDAATVPGSVEGLAEVGERFRAYATALDIAPRRERTPLANRRLARKIKQLLEEGSEALSGFPTRAVVASTENSFSVPFSPDPRFGERAGEFDGRARALLMSRRLDLLPLYAQGANAFLRRDRDKQADLDRELERQTNATRLKAFADRLHRRPALYLEACLEGLAAALAALYR